MNEANRLTWQSIVRSILGLQFGLWLVLAVWALPQPARAAFSSTEASTISWFYAAAFGRTPVPNSAAPNYGDLGGLAFWTETYLTGAGGLASFRGNVYAIADFFVTSDEFQAKYPASLTNEAFIIALYDNMLGRAADEGGLAFWVGQLSAGASRGTVLADFTNTSENQNSNPLRKAALESFIAFIDADADGTITPAEAAVWLAQNPTLDGALVDGASSEYQPGTTAPLTTDFEDVSEFSPGGAAMTLTLGDGTRASVTPLAGDYALLLERSSPEEALTQLMAEIQDTTALAPTGSVRWLVALGEGDPSNLKPVITIPAREAGMVNVETVNVLRVGDVLVNGALVRDYAMLLPVFVEENGNLRFVDPLMPDAVQSIDEAGLAPASRMRSAQTITAQATAAQATPAQWYGAAQYVLMTFQDDLDWHQAPRLVRMMPDETLSDAGYRRPAEAAELALMAKQPICNLVILVHGHNEQEKAGFEAPTAAEPWRFHYKRLVWDLLYKAYLEGEDYGANYPLDCTAFYEFIYPTYRPIFSPVPEQSGQRHETLGEAMGRLVQAELQGNPQLQAMLSHDMPFNLLVVSHSQGGLVARAGFRHLSQPLLQNLQRFISWGTPHRGAALVTMRYAAAAGHDLIWQGVKIPLQNIGQSETYQSAINSLQLDAPGTRDLRWDASKKSMLRLGEVFRENPTTGFDDRETELPNGTRFYSSNLAAFNDTEGQLGDLSSDKYVLFHGSTTKRANVEIVSPWWPWAHSLVRFGNATDIEKGAFLHELLMMNGYKPNDGAVPLYSQQAGELGHFVHGIRRIDMGDMDHEEFYGAEGPQREQGLLKGAETARATHYHLGLDTRSDTSRSCPTVEAAIQRDEDQAVITGRLDFPLYRTASGRLGQRIQRVEARVGGQSGAVIGALTFTYEDNGSFRGSGVAVNVPGGAIAVVAVLKDGSEVASANFDYSRAAGTATFSLERNQAIRVMPNYRRSGQDLVLDRSAAISVTVTYDGESEPTFTQLPGQPDHNRTLVIFGYQNPIAVSGTLQASLSFESFETTHYLAPGPSRYNLKRIEFEVFPTYTPGQPNMPVWQEPGGFTSLISIEGDRYPNWPYNDKFSFTHGRTRLVWEVQDHNGVPYEFVDHLTGEQTYLLGVEIVAYP